MGKNRAILLEVNGGDLVSSRAIYAPLTERGRLQA